MPNSAKEVLLTRLKSVDMAARLEALIDKDVRHREHNDTANLLRKGLGIVSFNILEDFIKSRTKEMFDFVSNSRVRFENLPDRLKVAATNGALKGLVFQVTLEKKNQGDWMSLIHSESRNIFSTSQNPFTLSTMSLLSESSNIGPEDIPDVLKCLDITGGWATLQNISSSLGGGTIDLNAAYKNMFSNRHKCAHEANFSYQYTQLENSLNDIVAISSAFDIAITTRCKYIDKEPNQAFSLHQSKPPFKCRFLISDGDRFREKISLDSQARTIKIWEDREEALDRLTPRLRTHDEFIIMIGRQRRINDWYI